MQFKRFKNQQSRADSGGHRNHSRFRVLNRSLRESDRLASVALRSGFVPLKSEFDGAFTGPSKSPSYRKLLRI